VPEGKLPLGKVPRSRDTHRDGGPLGNRSEEGRSGPSRRDDALVDTDAALSAGFALAFGLGGRDMMSGMLSGYYVRQRIQTGDAVTVGTLQGTVREVGPVATVIETRENGLVHRHSVPNSKMLLEAVR